MKKEILEHLKKENYKPFLFKEEDKNSKKEILIWEKDLETAKKNLKGMDKKLDTNLIKEIDFKEAEKINQNQEDEILKIKSNLEEEINKHFSSFKNLLSNSVFDDSFFLDFDNSFNKIFNDDFLDFPLLGNNNKKTIDKKSSKEKEIDDDLKSIKKDSKNKDK